MLDLAISVGVFNVTYCTEPWEETMRDIYGDCFAWLEIEDILVYKVGSGYVLKFSVQCFPAIWLPGRREDSLDDEVVCDMLGDFHLHVHELEDGEGHGFRVICNGMVSFQVVNVINGNWSKTKNLLCRLEYSAGGRGDSRRSTRTRRSSSCRE